MKSKAPARICLFGDHQDYLGLPVIACAINKYMIVEGVPNNANYLLFTLIDLNKIIKPIKTSKKSSTSVTTPPSKDGSIVHIRIIILKIKDIR